MAANLLPLLENSNSTSFSHNQQTADDFEESDETEKETSGEEDEEKNKLNTFVLIYTQRSQLHLCATFSARLIETPLKEINSPPPQV